MEAVFWRDDNHPLKYYFNEKVKIFEDEQHEFKLLTIKDEESIDSFLRIISKYICAYLNSNSGCIYIGINDDGIAKGLEISNKILSNIKKELNILISLFYPFALKESLIGYKFFEIFEKETEKKIEGSFILEIFTKKGSPLEIYTTPYKDSGTKDYECFIKLNGTTHKIVGNQLQKYIKNKIKSFYVNQYIAKDCSFDQDNDIFN